MDFQIYLIVHIGGASISGLAKILHKAGKKVYGWEKMAQNEKIHELEKSGIKIFTDKIPSNIIETIECVVHSSIESSEYIRNLFSLRTETQVYTQFKFINLLIKESKSIAVTGSYGKTITTTLLCHVFDSQNFDISFTCGGVAKNYNSNAKRGKSDIWIVEAVETHGNCLHLLYTNGIILNIESKSQIPIFNKFIRNAQNAVFINSDDINCMALTIRKSTNIITFGIENVGSDLQAINIKYLTDLLTFDIVWKDENLGSIFIPYCGFFSIYNVLAVIALSIYYGINIANLNKSFSTYLGVKKRFDFIFKNQIVSFLVDIAHHPVAIREVIKECRKTYSEIIILYRPHMFKELNQDAIETADALGNADKVTILEVESVKDKLDNGINAKEFVSLQKVDNMKWFCFNDNSDIINWLDSISFYHTIIIQMGMYIDPKLTNLIVEHLKKYYLCKN